MCGPGRPNLKEDLHEAHAHMCIRVSLFTRVRLFSCFEGKTRRQTTTWVAVFKCTFAGKTTVRSQILTDLKAAGKRLVRARQDSCKVQVKSKETEKKHPSERQEREEDSDAATRAPSALSAHHEFTERFLNDQPCLDCLSSLTAQWSKKTKLQKPPLPRAPNLALAAKSELPKPGDAAVHL